MRRRRLAVLASDEVAELVRVAGGPSGRCYRYALRFDGYEVMPLTRGTAARWLRDMRAGTTPAGKAPMV